MDKNQNILQTMILISVVTFIGVLGLSMPIVALTYPIVLTFIGLKNGINKNIITFITSLIFIGLISKSLVVLIIPLQYGILSAATVYMINKKYEVNKIILYSISLVFIMVIIHMGFNWYLGGINTFVEIEKTLIETTNQQSEILQKEDMREADKSQMINLLKTTVDTIVSVLPVLLMLSSAFIGYLNYYISSRLAKKSGRPEIDTPTFSKLIFPKHVIVGLGSLLLVSYGLKYVSGFNHMQLTNNILLIIYAVFLIEGLSITVHLINKMKMGKFFKVLFIVIIALSSFLNIVLFSLGMIDIILDFRKIRETSEA